MAATLSNILLLGVELELQGIAFQRCRICIGFVFDFLKDKNLYWYFIARIGIGIVLVFKDPNAQPNRTELQGLRFVMQQATKD